MERKIGEIFEYQGEWYQCVEQPKKYDKTVCAICAFQGNGNCELDRCSATYRSDKKSVIFKKLEKVGEPYEYFVQHRGIVMLQPYKLFATPFINGVVCNVNYDTNTIDLEIKQTKEEMEENYKAEDTLLTRLVGRYVNNLIDYETFEKAVKELYSDKKDSKLTLKEFDLEAAKSGKPVCTRDGRKARILCYDFKQNEEYPILVAVENKDGKECALLYSNDGISEMYKSSNNELAMPPEKKEGWVNICRDAEDDDRIVLGRIFESREEAVESAPNNDRYTTIATVRIEWEE